MFIHKSFLGLALGCLCLILAACNTNSANENAVSTNEKTATKMPKALLQGIEAHGGLDRWHEMETWAYTIDRNDKPERHFTDLKTRKALLTHDDYTLGFDGKEVWITPNKAAFGKGSPRFYHNLRWYFHAFPFVMADPGINYEVLPQKVMNGRTYDAIKISYDAGVGDAPDDYYIAHFDTETHQMYMLLYTVTYFQGKPGDKYNALIYDDWTTANGLLVPKSMTGYKYADGKLGDKRYDRPFSDIELTTIPAKSAMFKMPVGAEIDSLIQH